MEPDPKRHKSVEEELRVPNGNDAEPKIPEALEHLQARLEGRSLTEGEMLGSRLLTELYNQKEEEMEEETVESLRTSLENKEEIIRDLNMRLDEAQRRIKSQNEIIRDYQIRCQEIQPPAPSPDSDASSPELKASPSHGDDIEEATHKIQLQILQHPPAQAVYQRILRPFPTVAVVGVSHLKTCNNLFVEVSLLKQDEYNVGTNPARYTSVESTKNGAPLAGEKKHLIGGQLVQRSEAGSNPDTLIVVFRKLKVLTTTAQQGGAFFVLKFILKRYVDNNFEVVHGVTMAISDPMEVFSHTLYLKGRGGTTTVLSPSLSLGPGGSKPTQHHDDSSIVYGSNSNDSFLADSDGNKSDIKALSGKAAAATLAMVKPRSRSSSTNTGQPIGTHPLVPFGLGNIQKTLIQKGLDRERSPEIIPSKVVATIPPPVNSHDIKSITSGRSAMTKSKEEGLQGLFQLSEFRSAQS
eukprot:TRINITY_DN3282_c0_g2_i2.p1 TRINITY_DN3282_c0_g2~~TRINITY_DN3282_c0_g2_i2.p1  ORF type:complete len:466 (-),score=162.93 TRINITY_DN3282_c0_g2_i2:131-1528(-)